MHELPITEGILKIATEAAEGRRITTIHLLVGELSSIVDDSVQFYFDILSKGTAGGRRSARLPAPAGDIDVLGLWPELSGTRTLTGRLPSLRRNQTAGNWWPRVAGR